MSTKARIASRRHGGISPIFDESCTGASLSSSGTNARCDKAAKTTMMSGMAGEGARTQRSTVIERSKDVSSSVRWGAATACRERHCRETKIELSLTPDEALSRTWHGVQLRMHKGHGASYSREGEAMV